MASYLAGYGAGEERRNRIILTLILSAVGVLILAVILYFILHNYAEKKTVSQFLGQLNAHDYKQAYVEWGCTPVNPCPNYDYKRFMEDWGPQKKIGSPWKIQSIDGCKAFVTVNVEATGSELQSLAVERGTHSIAFAPAPECQEPKWRWKQFFQRIFGGGSNT